MIAPTVHRGAWLRALLWISVGFIEGKDWLISEAQPFPYLYATLGLLIAVVAARYISFALRIAPTADTPSCPPTLASYLLASVYTVAAVCFCAAPLVSMPLWDDRLWLGHGMGSFEGADMRQGLLYQEGIVAWAIQVLWIVLAMVLSYRAAMERMRKANASVLDVGAKLSILVVGTLVLILAVGPMHDQVPAITAFREQNIFWSSIAGLFLTTCIGADKSDRYSEERVGRPPMPIFAAGVCILAAFSAVVFALSAAVRALPAEARSAAGEEYVTHAELPQSVKDILSADYVPSWSPVYSHDLIRRSFGIQVSPPTGLAADIAFSLTSAADRSLASNVWDAALAIAIADSLPRDQIAELALNLRSYGTTGRGIGAATRDYFGVPVNQLAPWQARFLVGAQSIDMLPSTDPVYGSFPRPGKGADNLEYDCRLFPDPPVTVKQVYHDGAVNASGAAVETVFTEDSSYPYLVENHTVNRLLPALCGFDESYVVGMNDLDEAAGWSRGRDGALHAVYWDGAHRVHDLPPLAGYAHAMARAINNPGTVVGFSYNDPAADAIGGPLTEPAQACIWNNGVVRSLASPPGALATRAYAINSSGEIAGWWLNDRQELHAAVWEGGRPRDIGTLGGRVSQADAIDDAGVVVGSAQHLDGSVSAFAWQNGVMHDLGVLPGGLRSRAYGINEQGQIIAVSGGVGDPNLKPGVPFLWDLSNGPTPISSLVADPAWKRRLDGSALAFSINDGGTVLGLYYRPRQMPIRVGIPAVRRQMVELIPVPVRNGAGLGRP